jgi:hypothetical protein
MAMMTKNSATATGRRMPSLVLLVIRSVCGIATGFVLFDMF